METGRKNMRFPLKSGSIVYRRRTYHTGIYITSHIRGRGTETSGSGYTALCIQRQGDFLQHSQGTCISSNVLSGGSCSGIYKPEGKKATKRKQKRNGKDQLLMDYSEVLSRLIIFLGAGMSIRTAWDRIAEDYKMAVKEGRRGPRYVYEEM